MSQWVAINIRQILVCMVTGRAGGVEVWRPVRVTTTSGRVTTRATRWPWDAGQVSQAECHRRREQASPGSGLVSDVCTHMLLWMRWKCIFASLDKLFQRWLPIKGIHVHVHVLEIVASSWNHRVKCLKHISSLMSQYGSFMSRVFFWFCLFVVVFLLVCMWWRRSFICAKDEERCLTYHGESPFLCWTTSL